LWKGLQGNANTGSVPNDNDIAVSSTGFLVSVMNTSIFKYDLNADTSMGQISLAAFASALGNTNSKYDPKAIYDPDLNKFIVVFLAGFTHTTTSIIVAFSENDNPNGNWNLYELPGNPLDDSLWTDFPMVALTNHELFITVNHLVDNESWQTGWRRTVIWQVNKFDGFNGDSLHTQLHFDINLDGKKIRNLCPAKGGSHLYGSDIYFLSDRNLAASNDTFFLVHITDTINAPSQQLTAMALISPLTYFVPINGLQFSGGDLATNDARVLGAFYENNKIQFVGNTTDTFTATSAFYHGVISDVANAPSIDLHIISHPEYSYGYPDLSYAGKNSGDNTAIINHLRSGINLNGGNAALVTDGAGNYSEVKNVKSGDSYSSQLLGTERWGDYTGSQIDYNEPGKVWVNGSYFTSTHKTTTWISHLSLTPPPASVHNINTDAHALNVYPNPSADEVMIEFVTEKYSDCDFNLFDANGKLIKVLMKERVKPGTNQFRFSMAPLSSGEYLLSIISDGKVIASQKVIKQ
jgi:hypothetical protein